jgi:hypothetical protein
LIQEVRVKPRLSGLMCVVGAFVVLSACSGGGGSTPTTPTPAATSITVTSTGTHLHLGLTETFTATVTLSNGTSQPLTGGTWGTDAAAVATVGATTGMVTSIGSGEVTVFVDAQGVRGARKITVVPNYQGIWNGSYTMTSCAQSGQLADVDLCGTYAVGSSLPLALNLNQTAATVNGQTALGGLVSAPFTTVAATNGALTFQATFTLDTLQIAQAWQLTMAQPNQLAGSFVQTWTDSTETGQIVVAGTVNTMTKVSAQTQSLTSWSDLRSLAAVRDALGGK